MNKTRLLKLADHMEGVKPKKYNQSLWFTNSRRLTSRDFTFGPPDPETDEVQLFPKGEFCGAAACVLGHAAFVPGLGLALVSGRHEIHLGRRSIPGDSHLDIATTTPGGTHIYGSLAAAHVFEIPIEHARAIFGPTGDKEVMNFYGAAHRFDFMRHVTPQVVAATLRRYVSTEGRSILGADGGYPPCTAEAVAA